MSARIMHRPFAVLAVLSAGLLLALSGATCSITLVTPEKAEFTDTQNITLPAGAALIVRNDIGSTRVTVDEDATQATLELTRIAYAPTEAQAAALLLQTAVTVTQPTQANNNTLFVDAVKPNIATDDENDFSFTVSNDELTVTAILGNVQVVQYRLRITLPPGVPVSVTQTVGNVRAVGLDEPSTLIAELGSIRTLEGQAKITASATLGNIIVRSHADSLDLAVDTGSAEVEIDALAASDTVTVQVDTGSVKLDLPKAINADLQATVGVGTIDFDASDFTETSEVTDTQTAVQAVLNDGGAGIDLDVSVGSIDINGT